MNTKPERQLDMLHGSIWDKLPRFAFPVAAILTTLGVCGIRIAWIRFVFPTNRTFATIMNVYPVSLSATALLIFIALLCYRPSRRFAKTAVNE